MNRKLWMAAAFACGAPIYAAAQSPTGAGSATIATPSTNAITVTGCVQNISSADATGTTARGYLLALNGDGRGATPTPMPTPGATEGAVARPPQGTASANGTVTGTSGTTNTAAASAGAQSNETAGSSGAVTPTGHPSARLNNSYVLTGDDSELKDQVGHKVEVTGTVETGAEGTNGSNNAPSPSTLADSPKLHVLSVKKISSDCSAK